MTPENQKFYDMAEDASAYEEKLTNWERNFLTDILDKIELDQNIKLSDGQIAKLEQIHDKATS
jgi:hypothetical protein